MSRHHDVVAVVAAALLALGLRGIAGALTHTSSRREKAVASFAGGVSLAFVLLDLLVELTEGAPHGLHEVVRVGPEPMQTTALLILVGTATTFAAHVYDARHLEEGRAYAIAVVPQTLYGLLVGAALDGEANESAAALVVFWLAMVLHLGVAEHRLVLLFPRQHEGGARAVAAAAPIAGALIWTVAEPGHVAFQLLLALVAGATLLSIFREELPRARDVRLGAFMVGLVVSSALVQARWWL